MGKKEGKNIIPFRQNLLLSIRPCLQPIQFFKLGAMFINGKPPEREHFNQRRDSSKRIKPEKVRCWFLTASQMRFAQGELISGSEAIWPERMFQPITINETN